MTKIDLIILNFQEIRRRSIKLWNGLPPQLYHWRPDEKAMSAIEMIRHVLEADHGWNMIIEQEDMSNYRPLWQDRPFISVQDELEFAEPVRQKFMASVRRFSEDELEKTKIIHPGNGAQKDLGEYLLRIGYHEAVHAGHFLSYLRAMGVDRPDIWD